MYRIHKKNNRISALEKQEFSKLHIKERKHLQEWIANTPDFFGEEMLIIQKEFDGFDDTKERLDLLALDKYGDIVVIENKLDDSGRDVTWQLLKYASYCASLTKSQIKTIYQEYLDKENCKSNAEQEINDFYNVETYDELELNMNQRLIMVAGSFRKEVTSTVLWLLDNYKLKIQCFKVTPYKLDDELLLNVDQIIPVKEAEEYQIRMANKNKDEADTKEEINTRSKIRLEFWQALLNRINQTQSVRFQNINPKLDNWLSGSVGISGIGLNFVISNYYARTEVIIAKPNREENKQYFDKLYDEKKQIENEFGEKLEWERKDDFISSRIKHEKQNLNIYHKEDWPAIIDFMVDSMLRMEKVFPKRLEKINKTLNSDYKKTPNVK
jgi:hypothetical protein